MVPKFFQVSFFFLSLYSFVFAENKSPVAFTVEFVNQAWVFAHKGWLIDSSGNIRNFNFSRSDSMINKPYSTTHLNKMYSLSTPSGKTVPKDSLKSKVNLLKEAAKGELTYEGICADAGKVTYSGIYFDSTTSIYTRVILFQTGDQQICNSSLQSIQITRWLLSIDSTYSNLCGSLNNCIPTKTINPGEKRTKKSKLNESEFVLDGKKVTHQKPRKSRAVKIIKSQ